LLRSEAMKVGTGVFLSFFAVACGSGDADNVAASAGTDWQLLASLNWQLDPGGEDWPCTRKTLAHDLLIAQFEPFGPSGTHHTVLLTGEPSAADGQFGCDMFESRTMLFNAAAGTKTLTLPDGVAMRVRAGEQLFFGLHVFNTTLAPLRGNSGVRALIAKPAPGQVEAEAANIWAQDFVLPPGQETREVGGCLLARESTIFALHPHMHALGTHVKVVAHTGGTERVIHDAPFDFEEQLIYPIEPLGLLPGDRVEIECTFRNTRDSAVAYGPRITDEMCLLEAYAYPAPSDGASFCRY